MAAPTPTKPEQDIFRGCLKNRPHSIWGQTFVSLAPLDSELESHMEEVEAMKVQVKNMLLHSAEELKDNIQLINLLCRLGLSYHFEEEINEQLNCIFTMLPELLENNDYDLYTIGNLFRILRQYGYKMTCDVFKKFKNGVGEFSKDNANDAKGILSLYEACFLAIPGEDILEEALVFTMKHLEILAKNSSPHLKKHLRNSLMYPSHHTIGRLDALHYISFYEDDNSTNETLLKFAKLDYNRLQLVYRKELALLSTWWEKLNVVENLPYARDRLVETYTWTIGMMFEPQYGISRMLICKYMAVLTLMDDTYDSYGTIDELKLFTAALQRITIDVVDELPEYMKFLYRVIFELIEDHDTQGCSSKTNFVREKMAEIATGYYQEAIWLKERKAPSFDEYMKNGKVTSVYDMITSVLILGMDSMGMKEIKWVGTEPEIVVGAKLHPRFLNDINSLRTDETKRGDFPKAIDCYTIQYGVSQDEAIEAILKMLQNKWKEMNEDFLKPTTVPWILLKYTLNYARISIFFYRYTDLFTYVHNTKEYITSFFINPLPM